MKQWKMMIVAAVVLMSDAMATCVNAKQPDDVVYFLTVDGKATLPGNVIMDIIENKTIEDLKPYMTDIQKNIIDTAIRLPNPDGGRYLAHNENALRMAYIKITPMPSVDPADVADLDALVKANAPVIKANIVIAFKIAILTDVITALSKERCKLEDCRRY